MLKWCGNSYDPSEPDPRESSRHILLPMPVALRPIIHWTAIVLLIIIAFLSNIPFVYAADGVRPLAAPRSAHVHKAVAPYAFAEVIHVECKNLTTGEWARGPICRETGEPLQFKYGLEQFLYCSFDIESPEMYAFIEKALRFEHAWVCRVPFFPKSDIQVPFVLPLWGLAEQGHFHVGNHVNFVFHGQFGRILGVSAYPVADTFQYGTLGSTLRIHGPVMWFHGHSFHAMQHEHSMLMPSDGSSYLSMILVAFMTFIFTTMCLSCCYIRLLRPRIVKRVLAVDGLAAKEAVGKLD